MHESDSPGAAILVAIQNALVLRSHKDLFRWLQTDVRVSLPNDILIAAWGVFASQQLSLDVVSPLPGIRTTEIRRDKVLPLLQEMFDAWMKADRQPISISIADVSHHWGQFAAAEVGNDPGVRMRSAVVHGIRDERGGYDCLYVALCADVIAESEAIEAMEILLPYIDAAFRRVKHLPVQRHDRAGIDAGKHVTGNGNWAIGTTNGSKSNLSEREQEIMRWVSEGKTNPEIGVILGISPNTVRNHLRQIFRKLDVINRAQAVSQL